MNPDAIDLYMSHGIDLTNEPLEIAVCSQHMNGGADVDTDWQTELKGLYVIGEAAGTYGPRRPGGSALSAGQIGALRAADHVALSVRKGVSLDSSAKLAMSEVAEKTIEFFNTALANKGKATIDEFLLKTRHDMTSFSAHIRELPMLDSLTEECLNRAETIANEVSLSSKDDLVSLVKARDTLLAQSAICHAIKSAANAGSYGGALLRDEEKNNLPADNSWDSLKLITKLENGVLSSFTKKLNPIPQPNNWFENVWREYRLRG